MALVVLRYPILIGRVAVSRQSHSRLLERCWMACHRCHPGLQYSDLLSLAEC